MVGTTIAQYEILEQIGSGGMGVVYKARDTKLDRVVALKFLPAKAASDQSAKERFIQEAKAASSLDDPHICTIFDIGEADDGQLFIVMAFYDGSTLRDLLEKRQIKIEDAASIARQMAKGLATAHEAGIVHRDVKPANVMVTKKGLVKLLDFGVAKLSESSDLTREGSTIGTAAYMSPEQARGESLDARSDVWSIGAVLYEMITGSRPFGGGYEAAVAYSIINESPPEIPLARPETPEGLVEVVARALSKDPTSRYPTAKALADDLSKYSGETIVETAEQPAVVKAGAEVPSLRRVAIIFSVAAVLVLGVVYAAMMAFGLPDWVFPTAVFLVLAGLPIVLYSATIEKQRQKMDSGEKARLSGVKSWLSTKLAYRGGLLAGGALVVAVVGYTILRAAGIGPFASLITSGALTEQDKVVVAQFENLTSDASLGVAVTEAFRIDLGQSTAIRLLDRSAVQSSLTRMGENPDTVLSRDLALEVARREGVKAIIEGDITAAGASFILNARVLSAVDGSLLAGFRENAQDDRELLSAIDQLSADVREGIGESLVSIRGNEPLAQVSTSSFEALRLFTEGEMASNGGRTDEAIELLNRAIAEDSLFAMAYRKLGVLYSNTGAGSQLVDSVSQIAYDLRDRLPQLERMQTEAYYWWTVGDDVDETERIYQEILKRYPHDTTALNNLALIYNRSGRFAEAEPLLRRALEEDEIMVLRNNLVTSVLNQGRVEDALEEIDAYETALPNLFRPATYRVQVSFLMDDFEGTEAWLDSADARPKQSNEEDDVDSARQAYFLSRGRISDSRPLFESNLKRNLDLRDTRVRTRPRDLDSLMGVAWYELYIANMTGDTRTLESTLAEIDSRLENVTDVPSDELPLWGLTRISLFAGLIDRANGYLEPAREWQNAQPGGPGENTPILEAEIKARQSKDPVQVEAALDGLRTYWSTRGCLRCDRDAMGELYEILGDTDAAIEAYTQYATAPQFGAIYQDRGFVAVVQFRLGALYEQTGDLDSAITWYTRMIDRWSEADAVLQPQVAEARRRIEVLLDRKAQEGS